MLIRIGLIRRYLSHTWSIPSWSIVKKSLFKKTADNKKITYYLTCTNRYRNLYWKIMLADVASFLSSVRLCDGFTRMAIPICPLLLDYPTNWKRCLNAFFSALILIDSSISLFPAQEDVESSCHLIMWWWNNKSGHFIEL